MRSPASPKPRLLIVPPEQSGKRLDIFVASCFPELSRTQAQNLIREGHVVPTVPVKNLKSGILVLEGQSFKVTLPAPVETHMLAQALDLDILFEDPHLLVVNKPVGLVVHPGAGNPDNTLLNALIAHCPNLKGVGGVKRPGLVHRLDKDTSGLLVVAKSDLAYRGLVAQLKTRKLSREYLGIVRGSLEGKGMVDAPIGRHAAARKKMSVRPDSGKEARTHFRSLERNEAASLLLLKLETGRTHQIRVHMAYIQHPILGDGVYGGESELASRQMLHAFRLSLKHPKTGASRIFCAPPPEDFTESLGKAGLKVLKWKKVAWK